MYNTDIRRREEKKERKEKDDDQKLYAPVGFGNVQRYQGCRSSED